MRLRKTEIKVDTLPDISEYQPNKEIDYTAHCPPWRGIAEAAAVGFFSSWPVKPKTAPPIILAGG